MIRTPHTGGDPLTRHVLFQYEHTVNCDVESIRITIRVSLTEVFKAVTVYSEIKCLI